MAKQTLAALQQLNEAMFGAYNAHDAAGVLELLTDDITWDAPDGHYVGKTEVGAALEELFDAFPDASWPMEDVVLMLTPDHKMGAVTWTMKGTQTGPYNGLPATGKHVELSGVTLVTMTGPKVSGLVLQFDAYDYLTQLGVVPSTEGVGFKMLAMTEFSINKAKEALHL